MFIYNVYTTMLIYIYIYIYLWPKGNPLRTYRPSPAVAAERKLRSQWASRSSRRSTAWWSQARGRSV